MAWNRPSENGEAVSRPLQKRKGFRFPVRGAIAGAIVVLGAAVAAWWLLPNDESAGETPQPQSARRIKEVAPAAAPAPAPEKPIPSKPKKYSNDPSTQLALQRRAEFQKQLATDPVLQFHMTNQAPSKMLFKTATEQALDFILNTPVGSTPPPAMLLSIPAYELDRLGEILSSVEPYDKDDPQETKERKMLLQRAKDEFKKYVEAGGKPRDFLNYYYQELERCHGIWEESQKAAVEAARFDDPDAAREFIDKINANLNEKGIEPVKLRPTLKHRLGIKDEE